MKKSYYKKRISIILNYLSTLLTIAGLIIIIPFAVGLIYGESSNILLLSKAFIAPGIIAVLAGLAGKRIFKGGSPMLKDAMFICVMSWVLFTLLGAVPYTVILNMSYLNAAFETMSGFTTTGITLLTGLDNMPRSILFWRSFTQWIGGLGILSMFILIGIKGGAAVNKLFLSESHKIAAKRPHPGLLHTVKTLWIIYVALTAAEIIILSVLGLSFFDAMTHTFTTLSTGGFSIYDQSIAHYKLAGFANSDMIELTYMLFMLLGGINFFVLYNVFTGNVKSLIKNIEVRHLWYIVFGGTFLVFLSYLKFNSSAYTSVNGEVFTGITAMLLHLKDAGFQVISILTTTGFATRDINGIYFTALAKQLFLIFMVIGACSGSTGGGIKIIRVVTLLKIIKTKILKVNSSFKSRVPLTIDKHIVENDEIYRIVTIVTFWMILLISGGAVTAFFSNHTAFESFSGMFSAVGNIGPCYISVKEMIALHPAVKLTYIFGMLAGRLEIIPVILIFNKKFFK